MHKIIITVSEQITAMHNLCCVFISIYESSSYNFFKLALCIVLVFLNYCISPCGWLSGCSGLEVDMWIQWVST